MTTLCRVLLTFCAVLNAFLATDFMALHKPTCVAISTGAAALATWIVYKTEGKP